jgi:primary-amine oxidase
LNLLTGIPIPSSTNTDYRYVVTKNNRPAWLKPPNPISMEQPAGPSFTVTKDHQVKWAGWDFHIKADARAGIIISGLGIIDPETGKRREVMYKGLVSELFVPYMDPTDAWYFKTYMDAGEYGFGLQAMPLVPLNDCPRNAHYLDGVFIMADGKPYVRENMICLFEKYAGDIAWRHSECPITDMEVWSYPLVEQIQDIIIKNNTLNLTDGCQGEKDVIMIMIALLSSEKSLLVKL